VAMALATTVASGISNNGDIVRKWLCPTMLATRVAMALEKW